MPFDLHAFISYAHIDNEPLEPGQPGWVSRFHAVLKTRLSQRLGEPARLWRDDKLRGDDVFDDEIRAQLPRAALLVSILTPRYVRSGWCKSELDGFAAAAAATGGVQVRNLMALERGAALIVFSNTAQTDFGQIWQGKGLSHELASAAFCGEAASAAITDPPSSVPKSP